MKKTKLMLALKSLQMNNADKNKLADTIIDIGNNSNGGGNETGVKSYYYRLKTPTVIKDTDELKIILGVTYCSNFIVASPTYGNALVDFVSIVTEATNPSIAMVCYDVPAYISVFGDDIAYNIKFIGDLATRLTKYISMNGGEMTYDDVVAMLSQMVEPITEEEFFNLVDVEIK